MSIKEKLKQAEERSRQNAIESAERSAAYEQQQAKERKTQQDELERHIKLSREAIEEVIRITQIREVLAETKDLFTDGQIVEEERPFGCGIGRVLRLQWNFGRKTEYVSKLGGLYAVPREIRNLERYDYTELIIFPEMDNTPDHPSYKILVNFNSDPYDYKSEGRDRLEELIVASIRSPEHATPHVDDRSPGLNF